MQKKLGVVIAILLVILTSLVIIFRYKSADRLSDEYDIIPEVKRPLLKYSIDNLSNMEVDESIITITDVLDESPEFTSYLFTLEFKPDPKDSESKITTGQINIPNYGSGKYPLVLMIRGYVDEEIYETGIGTRNAAAYFAENGFITIAPDFLGYGGSSDNEANIFESRFQTYTTIIALINSIDQFKMSIGSTNSKWDGKNAFIWAHSNGGQIALTTLEVTGKSYPTTLWAPVTAPFPYSVLFYTIDSPDGGKFIRRELAEFEDLYDTDLFSMRNYLDRIKAPIQIHQGTLDDAVPYEWNRSFSNLLKNNGVEVNYMEYAADHNMRPVWDAVVARDLEFFNSNIID